MRLAIDEANSKNIILFAAASNYGNITEIAFPARLYAHEKVMCMFATNAAARSSPEFNPSPLEMAKFNFAILGEEILVPGQEALSGTSYSAVIAGAVAARVLDFAQQPDICNCIHEVDQLKSFAGIKSVFINMTKNAVDNLYHCIVPWKLLGPYASLDDIPSEQRQVIRLYICATLSRALAM